jgi:hypothetical protein
VRSLPGANGDGNDNDEKHENKYGSPHKGQYVQTAFVQKILGNYCKAETLVSKTVVAKFQVVSLEAVYWSSTEILRLEAERHVLPLHLQKIETLNMFNRLYEEEKNIQTSCWRFKSAAKLHSSQMKGFLSNFTLSIGNSFSTISSSNPRI